MVWVRLDDGFADHPKIERVGDAGLALFVRGLCYCNRQLTDGRIPLEAARRMGTARAADALVSAGLWAKDGDGFTVHDYDKYNPSRASVLAEREANAERQRKWKEERKKRRLGNAQGNAVTNAVTARGDNGVGNGAGNGLLTGAPPPPPPPALLRSARGRGGDGACAPAERRAAPGKDRTSKALSDAGRVGVDEGSVRSLIEASGIEAVERANVAGLALPVRADAVRAWFSAARDAGLPAATGS